MSRTYRHSDDNHPRQTNHSRGRHTEKPFRCRHCRAMVGPIAYGGKHRNHCPYCLYSRHVDARVPGDRGSACGGSMAPIGAFTRRNGEHVIVHHCLTCTFERYNRIASDDYFDLVLSLPILPAQPARQVEQPTVEEQTA